MWVMFFRPAQQEVAFAWMIISVVTIIFVGIGVYYVWRSRKQGFGSYIRGSSNCFGSWGNCWFPHLTIILKAT